GGAVEAVEAAPSGPPAPPLDRLLEALLQVLALRRVHPAVDVLGPAVLHGEEHFLSGLNGDASPDPVPAHLLDGLGAEDRQAVVASDRGEQVDVPLADPRADLAVIEPRLDLDP